MQAIFKNPYVSSAPVLTPESVGNGTLTVDRLTHFTISQSYHAICTGISPFTVFRVVGSLDGPLGVAQVAQQFTDEDRKIFLTINQGPAAFEIGDRFDWTVVQGTDVTQENLDTYDELPQKNFSVGLVGSNSGDDNLRFESSAKKAAMEIQDLTYEAKSTGFGGNDIRIRYWDSGVALKASLTIQDLKYEADSEGAAGNGISIEYIESTPAIAATGQLGDVGYDADDPGAAGNSITIEYTDGAPTSTPVISVLGSAITAQIQDGVTTSDQIKVAINGTPAARDLVIAFNLGTGTEVQDAPAGPASLADGADSSGLAGFEVVSLVGSAITVQLETSVSTATQVKAAVDAHPGASALVNTTITGIGSNAQFSPVSETNLQGGQDAAGGPGSEIIEVSGSLISVGFQDGVNTAANIKAKIDATPAAAALVDVTITGTSGNPQGAPASSNLKGGLTADAWAFNINEITGASTFYRGGGGLLVARLYSQGDLTAQGAVKALSTMALDDQDATNGSGVAVENVQASINGLIQNGKAYLKTADGSAVEWSTPDLIFGNSLVIYFSDTGHHNTILASESPITLDDGESVYIEADCLQDVTVTPQVGTTIPDGVNVLRIATRRGLQAILWDNSTLVSGRPMRIGSGVDLTNQVMTLLEGGGTLTHSVSTVGQISWDAPLKIRPLGSDQEISILAGSITLADNEVAYIEITDPIVTGNATVLKAARSITETGLTDRFWLFHRWGSRVSIRNGSTLVQGEERTIGEPISEDVFGYLGSSGETDNDPDYTNAVAPARTPTTVADSDNLTKAVAKIDAKLDRVPSWQKFTVTHIQLQAAALTNSITLFALPAKGVVHATMVKHGTAFAGTGITAYSLEIGIAANASKYAGPFDAMQAVSDSAKEVSSSMDNESMTGSTNILITATAVGANLDQSTAGSVDIWVLAALLP